MAKKTSAPWIGAHVGRRGSLASTIDAAEAIGATAIQIFGSSPRVWRTVMPKADDVSEFKMRMEKSPVRAVFLHAAYLVNLASASGDLYAFSTQSLIDHMKIADAIGAKGLIFHLGSFKGGDRDTAFEREVAAMKRVLESVPGTTKLIMENTAGGGDKIGASIEDVARIYHAMKSDRVKICYDTAHGFEAGLVSEYTAGSVKNLFDAWEKAVGMDAFAALHANDSKTLSGSHHDQHENIGEGHIGIQGFKALCADVRLRALPWLLETPGFDGMGPDKKNIETLRSCFS